MKKVAVSLELIHAASLIHDDVIDDAEIRRGKLTVKAKWDNRVAMYTGDYIFARSLELMTEIEKPDAHRILSNTMVELGVGEIEQMKDKYRFDQNLRDYLRRIKRKTALLISASCQLGAIAADVDKDVHVKLARFGYYVGCLIKLLMIFLILLEQKKNWESQLAEICFKEILLFLFYLQWRIKHLRLKL